MTSTQHEHISKKRILYTVPGMDNVIVRRDHEYAGRETGSLTMDLYYPADAGHRALPPAVVFVTGFSDAGAQRMLGCKFKDMGSYISWAEIVAASGMVGITYENMEPASDAQAALDHVREHASQLGIDGTRIAVWSCSGNVPTALSLLTRRPAGLNLAVLCYGYMLDDEKTTSVADAASRFGFANPAATNTIEDLPPDLALFIVRAGQDQMPGLNDTIDRFLHRAMKANLSITFVNHAAAPHAFDVYSDDQTSRDVIAQILQFMRSRLAVT